MTAPDRVESAASAQARAIAPPRFEIDRIRDEAGLRCDATDLATGRPCFLKLSRDSAATAHEARALAAVAGPAAPRLLDWGTSEAGGWLAMERLDGESLAEALARGPLPAAEARALLLDLAAAVEATHRAGLLHRDLKPTNVILRASGAPALIDFDAAIAIGGDDRGSAAEARGSDGYAAPERYRPGAPLGPWTDLYALAAIGCEVLTGMRPAAAPVRATAPDVSDPALAEAARVAPALAAALGAALALDPRERPADAAAWREMLARPESELDGEGASTMSAIAAAALEADRRDDFPPTVKLAQTPGAAETAAAPAPAAAPGRGPRWALAALAAAAAAAGVAVAFGRPFYDRHVANRWVVDPTGADWAPTSISEALLRAAPGAEIMVRPGTYAESVRLDKPALLKSSDPDDPAVIAPPSGPCVTLVGDDVAIEGFTIRGAEASDSSAPAQACVVVERGAPRIERNLVSAMAGPAILVDDGARPTVRANAVVDAPRAAIVVRNGAAPVIENNRIVGSGSVIFSAGAKGSFSDNRLVGGVASAIQVATGAAPTLTGVRIENPAEAGIFVYDLGRARIEGGAVTGAKLSGVVVTGGAAELRNVEISGSGEHGVLALDGAEVRIEGSTITGNHGNGLVLGPKSRATLEGNRVTGNRDPQVVDLR